MKEIIKKMLPGRVYSFLIRFNKIVLTEYATFGLGSKNSKLDKKILIVKPDAIGDYIMFRNFIKELKDSKKYKDYKIYLLGNSVWKELSNKLDKEYLESSYFIDTKYIYSRKYIKRLIKELNKQNFEITIHPVFHRQFIVDNIIKQINSKEKIGYSGKAFHQGKLELEISDKIYTKLIKTNQALEFDKCKDFFSKIINDKLKIKNPKINIKKTKQNNIVVNPGASTKFKQWKPENFAELIDYIIKKYKTKVFIVGSKPELDLDNNVRNLSNYKDQIEIFNGKSLIEVLNLIAASRGVISNETSTTHMAVALGKKAYCVVSGLGYGTAYPYPNYKDAIYFYPPSFIKKMWNEKLSDINEIIPKDIVKNINF